MELNWSTFFLEAVNFLILVWLLKRFLYRPVAAVIEARRLGIERSLADAKTLHDQAERLRQQYEARLAEWALEKQQARDALQKELSGVRERSLEELRQNLQQEKEKAEVLERRRLVTLETELERRSVELGGLFAARLLARVSGPDTESRLADLLIEELANLPEERWTSVNASFPEGSAQAVVSSAYGLDERQRADVQQALSAQVGRPVDCDFIQDGSLIAGLRVEFGPLVLKANIRDELDFFTDLEEPHAQRAMGLDDGKVASGLLK